MKTPRKDLYQSFRNSAFQSSRAELGLPPTSAPTQAWGVVMDWGLPEGTATVVAFSDGNARVYLSNGGGPMVGASPESIRKAAKEMVAIAAQYRPPTYVATDYPLPRRAQVIFYFLTDAGIFTAGAAQAELSPLSRLGDAARDIITQHVSSNGNNSVES